VTPRITVLRLGHRIERDKRLTTHVLLVARAFGAGEAIYSGQRDPVVEAKVSDVVARWGGPFEIRYERDWLTFVRTWDGTVCHLTMYGTHIDEKAEEIANEPLLLVVVGSEKVPGQIYDLADYNIAVGNQPHSEVSALAIFLDRIHRGAELHRRFEGARISVVPQEKGKNVRIIDIKSEPE